MNMRVVLKGILEKLDLSGRAIFDNSALNCMAGQISTLASGMLGYELFEQLP